MSHSWRAPRHEYLEEVWIPGAQEMTRSNSLRAAVIAALFGLAGPAIADDVAVQKQVEELRAVHRGATRATGCPGQTARGTAGAARSAHQAARPVQGCDAGSTEALLRQQPPDHHGLFQNPRPMVPFSSNGGFGAWELAARYSRMNLNFDGRHRGNRGSARERARRRSGRHDARPQLVSRTRTSR